MKVIGRTIRVASTPLSHPILVAERSQNHQKTLVAERSKSHRKTLVAELNQNHQKTLVAERSRSYWQVRWLSGVEATILAKEFCEIEAISFTEG
jgi:hypothetical protein